MSIATDLDSRVEALCGDLSSIRAPRGTELNARSWSTEAPLRMLLNNLDAEVAERPEELVVYGGSGRAARSHDALRAIVRCLLRLGNDETLLVQSGKPVGVFTTHVGAPRVLIANSLLVPRWASWDEFRRLEALGATIAGGAILCVEVDPARIERRLATRYLDEAADSLDDAVARVRAAAAERRPLSVGLLGNAAEILPELARKGEPFDLVTDQTAAHDPLNGYVPTGLDVEAAAALRSADPDEYLRRARVSIVHHVSALLDYVRAGSYVFDYGNNLRGEAREGGGDDAFSYP